IAAAAGVRGFLARARIDHRATVLAVIGLLPIVHSGNGRNSIAKTVRNSIVRAARGPRAAPTGRSIRAANGARIARATAGIAAATAGIAGGASPTGRAVKTRTRASLWQGVR